MATGRRFAVILVLNLLVKTFGLPADVTRSRRGYADNELDSEEQLLGEAAPARITGDSVVTSGLNGIKTNDPLDNGPPPSPEVIKTIFGEPKVPETPKDDAPSNPAGTLPPIPDRNYEADKKGYESSPATTDDDDDDDFEFESLETSPTIGVGSNIFSLLSFLGSLFGGSSSGATILAQRIMRDFVKQYLKGGFTFSLDDLLRHKRDTKDNEIETDYTDLTILKPPPARQEQESEENSSSETSENNSLESLEDDDDNIAEEENLDDPEDDDKNDDSEDDDDDDEPPGGGDGEGGGILGLLAGLSGGEDGQSDLGSLLAAVSGIVANLSGDGIDINALIATGIGLFVGLLSEGEENPGAVIAGYLLTSLDTLSGGGAKNNGNFFGSFLSKLIKGTSAASPPAPPQQDSWWTPLWNLKLDIIRAFFSASTGLAGVAFSTSSG